MAKNTPKHRREMESGRGGNKAGRLVKVPFSDHRFLRIELTAAEKDEFRSLLANGEFDGKEYDDWCRAGHKLSVSFDFQHNTFTVSLTGQYVGMSNAGLVVTARGSTVATALAALQFKLDYIIGDDEWVATQDSRGGSYDDIG